MKKIQNKETGMTEKKVKEPNPAVFFRFVISDSVFFNLLSLMALFRTKKMAAMSKMTI